MSCPDKQHLLSLYLDDELSDDERREVEDHLKRCEDCRSGLAAMRGIERRTDRAIKALQVPEESFVGKVMSTISGRHKRTGGGGTNWTAFIAILCGTVLLVVIAAAMVIRRFGPRGPTQPPIVVGKLTVDSEPVEVQLPEGGTERLEGASEIVANSTVTAGPKGAVVIAHSRMKFYLAPGARLGFPGIGKGDYQPTVVFGEAFVRDTGLVASIEARRDLRVRISDRSAAYIRADEPLPRVIEGRMTISEKGETTERLAGIGDDVRDFAPSWVPVSELPSPWPCDGGSHLGSGWTPLKGPGKDARAEVVRIDMKALPEIVLDRDGRPVTDILKLTGPGAVGTASGAFRPDGTTAYSYGDRVVVFASDGTELRVVGGISPAGPPVLLADDEPVIAAGSILRRGDLVAGPISEKLRTGPAADREGYSYAVGGGGYLLGLGPEGECLRMKIDGLAPVRPTVTKAGEIFVATSRAVWKLPRGAEELPGAAFAGLDSAPSCQMISDGAGRLYCATKSGRLIVFSPAGARLLERDLGSPASSMALGRRKTLWLLLEDGSVWKVWE